MTVIRSFIKQILFEGKIEDLQKKYGSNVPISFIAEKDPSPTKKYLEWMCKQYFEMERKRQNDIENGLSHIEAASPDRLMYDMFPTIKYFHRNIQKFSIKDINSYKTVKELEDAVKEIETKNVDKNNDSSSAKKLYEDERYLVIRPDNKQAVMKYGAGTKWCITMKDADYYENYIDNGTKFYFMIDKSPISKEWSKVAVAISSISSPGSSNVDYQNNRIVHEYFNANDDQVTEQDILDNFGEIIADEFLDKIIEDIMNQSPSGSSP